MPHGKWAPTAAENRCLARSFGSQALVLPHSLWAIESRNVLIRIPQNGSAAGNWQLVWISVLHLGPFSWEKDLFQAMLSEIIVSRLWFYDKLHWDQDRHANACVDIVLANSPVSSVPAHLKDTCWLAVGSTSFKRRPARIAHECCAIKPGSGRKFEVLDVMTEDTKIPTNTM